MAEEEKNSTKAWIQVLTPIILALIALVVPMYDKCKCNNISTQPIAEKRIENTVTNQSNSSITPPNSSNSSSVTTKNTQKDSITFIGKVTSLNGVTGVNDSYVTIGGLGVKTDTKGCFRIKIPSSNNKFIVTACKSRFQCRSKEFLLKDNGTAIIELRPE